MAKAKIYCANCKNCKVVKVFDEMDGSKFRLRVRCEGGKWQKKGGMEKLYKYFTIAKRTVEKCSSYAPMGDIAAYIKDLQKNLPGEDELYA